MFVNSFFRSCKALRSPSVDAATAASLRFCCASFEKVVVQSSVTGYPRCTAFTSVLRHSRMPDICSMAAHRKSFEKPELCVLETLWSELAHGRVKRY